MLIPSLPSLLISPFANSSLAIALGYLQPLFICESLPIPSANVSSSRQHRVPRPAVVRFAPASTSRPAGPCSQVRHLRGGYVPLHPGLCHVKPCHQSAAVAPTMGVPWAWPNARDLKQKNKATLHIHPLSSRRLPSTQLDLSPLCHHLPGYMVHSSLAVLSMTCFGWLP